MWKAVIKTKQYHKKNPAAHAYVADVFGIGGERATRGALSNKCEFNQSPWSTRKTKEAAWSILVSIWLTSKR